MRKKNETMRGRRLNRTQHMENSLAIQFSQLLGSGSTKKEVTKRD